MDARKQELHALVHDFTRIQTLCLHALLIERSVDACGQALIHKQKIMRARASNYEHTEYDCQPIFVRQYSWKLA